MFIVANLSSVSTKALSLAGGNNIIEFLRYV